MTDVTTRTIKFSSYFIKNWEFHLKNNSSFLIKKISGEVSQFKNKILYHTFHFNRINIIYRYLFIAYDCATKNFNNFNNIFSLDIFFKNIQDQD